MTDVIPCEFFVVRYVPDVTKGEFVNIGIVLRVAEQEAGVKREAQVRFTRNWRRVLCLDPHADIDLLVAIEEEWASVLASDQAEPFMAHLGSSLSNSIQITEPRASLAQSLDLELNQLSSMYVESKLQVLSQLDERSALVKGMRSQFEDAGVWSHMLKKIPASQYTQAGDPMRLDCGYRSNGTLRIFHAVPFRGRLTAAKAFAYAAPLLAKGVLARESRTLDLIAVIESPLELFKTSEHGEISAEAREFYQFGVELLNHEGIRVLPTTGLTRAAEAAKTELHM